MASQEFLASFGVEIDEAGVTRLQNVLEEAFAEELGLLDLSGSGITQEGFSGLSGLKLGLDVTPAQKDLNAFIEQAKKPVALSANGSAIVSAGRTAYNSVRSIFSTPITIRANVVRTVSGGAGDGDGGGTTQRMSTGGRFTRPTDVQVAEDGDAEYIIPVKKEDRAVPLLRQLLGELSPAAREQLTGGAGDLLSGGGLAAGNANAGSIMQNNQTVSAPVNIHVHASGASAEQIGESLYDTAERYLLRTLRSTTA